MSRLFKALPLLLLISASAFAQGTTFDCSFVFTGTATGVQLKANSATSRPCRSFAATYTTTGFTSITVSFGVSPDSNTANYTAVPNTACASTSPPVAPCVLTGASPITAGKSGEGSYLAYSPYVGINVSSVTGSGTYTITVYGYKGLSANAGGGTGSGGGGNLTIAGTTNQIAVSGAGCTPTNSGTCTVKLPNANVTIDPTTGNFGTPGTVSTGTGGGTSGVITFTGGSSGSAALGVPTAAGSPAQLNLPIATAGGSKYVMQSDGATPQQLSYAAPAGTGVQVVRATAAGTSGNCMQWAAAGAADAGAPCGTGSGGTAGATLFSTTASTTVTAASATTLIGTLTGSLTVPANTFTAGSVMEFMGQGFYTSTGSRTLNIQLFVGGSAQIATGAVTVPGATLGTWQLRCVVTTRTAGNSGTQIANCMFNTTGATLTAPGDFPMQVSAAWTVNTTGTLALDLKATWDSTTGAPTITATNVAAWIPGAPVTSVFGQTGAVDIPVTTTDIATPANPSAGATKWYTKSGTLCALAPAGTETCTGSGGSGGITESTTITPNSLSSAPAAAVPLTGWTLKNVANAHQSVNDFYPNELVMSSGNFAANQWGGMTRAVTVPYTIIAMVQMRGFVTNPTSAGFQIAGVCVSDGTKYESIGMLATPATTNINLEVRTMTSLSAAGTQVAGPTTNIAGPTLAIKIANNSTNRVFSYWKEGAWVQFLSEASGTSLTENAAGICSISNMTTGGFTLDEALRYWSVQ